MLKEIEAMINIQKQVQDIMKIAGETNTIITEMEQTILQASINNQTMNATNILGISENLRYLIQSNMEDQIFQIQRMLENELDTYMGKGNQYMDDNIREIQELYKNEEQEKKLVKGRVEDEEVILIKPYEVLESMSSSTSSFIDNEVNNLIKYMKFICSPTQTRMFRLLPHYQSLKSRGEQDPEFWKEITTALVENKHNTETSQNGCFIAMYQGGPLHELYFIAINN